MAGRLMIYNRLGLLGLLLLASRLRAPTVHARRLAHTCTPATVRSGFRGEVGAPDRDLIFTRTRLTHYISY